MLQTAAAVKESLETVEGALKIFSRSLLSFALILLLAYYSQAAELPPLRGAMVSPRVQAGDLQVLGQVWNANFVRWQLTWSDPKSQTATPAEYQAWLESALNTLDQMLPACEKAGLKVLVDLHSLPGGSDSVTRYHRIFTDQASQTQFIEVWNLIARRYAGNTTVWGYDLANEPIQGGSSGNLMRWQELATVVARNIRAVDTAHTLVVEPANGAIPESFASFSPLPSSIANVVYSVHMYNPHEFTHQGLSALYPSSVRYPGVVKRKMWDKKQLASNLKPVLDFQKKYGARILVGEFSAIRYAPAGSAYKYLKDVIDIFESNGWDWTYHAFREWNGWSVEHTEDKKNDKPSTIQTNREKLLRSYFNKNSKF